MTGLNHDKNRLDGLLARLADDIQAAGKGQRTTTIYKAAFTLGGFTPVLIGVQDAENFLLSCVDNNSAFSDMRNEAIYQIREGLRKGSGKPLDTDTRPAGKWTGKRYTPPRITRAIDPAPPVYDFRQEEALDEQAARLEYEGGLTRQEAEMTALNLSGLDPLRFRLFSFCVNRKTLNKETPPLAFDFEPVQASLDTLKDYIKQGFSFTPALFSGTDTALAYRSKEHWTQAEMIVLDLDHLTRPLADVLTQARKEGLLFAYTTPSHTEQAPRLRLVFGLAYVEKDLNIYDKAVKNLARRYAADETDNAAKGYYGNTNAIFYEGKKWTTA